VPYPVLVAALGAIVATAFAMFGLHSWSAMKIAPVVGAILGLIFAMISLRRHGLAFGTTLEEYRGAARVQSLDDSYSLYAKIANVIVAVVSIVELPFILIGQAPAQYIFVAGWIVIIAYTLYRAWQIGDASLFGNFDVFQVVGGAAFLTILATMLFIPMQAGMPIQPVPAFDMVTMILVLNAFVAMGATIIAIFGLNLLYRFLDLTNTPRR
jgi:hypothetical protein